MTASPPPFPPPPPTQFTPKPKRDPFIYQLAKLAVATPIVAIILGCLTQPMMKDDRSAALVIGGVNIFFILSGFLASIATLAATTKYGFPRLLTRGIVGLILNGLFLLAFIDLIFFMPHLNSPASDHRIIGTWSFVDSGSSTRTVTINPDNTFQFHLVTPIGSEYEASGRWAIEPGPSNVPCLVLNTQVATGILSNMAGHATLLPLGQVNENEITSSDGTHVITYKRVPK